ncbi:MAG: Protein kinase domain-containing protein [Rickettsia helvetica]|uniref:Protein kinase domain-containing protein n=1 Tax=Rickettsia helvetica TaxID=35789 RepID=A0ABM9NCS4_RICHE|nr:hypothetical protein [Rickettsia endosymbiont of Ixodes ricinus]
MISCVIARRNCKFDEVISGVLLYEIATLLSVARNDKKDDITISKEYYHAILTNTENSYGLIAKFFHWTMSIIVIVMLVAGFPMDNFVAPPLK